MLAVANLYFVSNLFQSPRGGTSLFRVARNSKPRHCKPACRRSDVQLSSVSFQFQNSPPNCSIENDGFKLRFRRVSWRR